MNFKFYIRILVHHPLLFLAIIGVIVLTCVVVTFTLKDLPNFADPQVGFETRGTELSKRHRVWKSLYEATRFAKSISSNPRDLMEPKTNVHYGIVDTFQRLTTKRPPRLMNREINMAGENESWAVLGKLLSLNILRDSSDKTYLMPEGFLCGPPHEDYAKIVLQSKDGSDLFTIEALKSICDLELQMMNVKSYTDLCTETFQEPRTCCRSWSLSNYVAQLQSKDSCTAITKADVEETKNLLKRCAQFYYSDKLNHNCLHKVKCLVPSECMKYNAVYNILNYITGSSFLSPDFNTTSNATLQETMLFLPLPASESMLEYYHELVKTELKSNLVQLVAMDFGIKNVLFNEFMILDAFWLLLGCLLIFCTMWLYTESLFLTSMTISVVIFSLGVAYFMYVFVYQLNFFPFLNLIALVVILGIGTDDMFIFCKIWESARKESALTLNEMIEKLNEAFISIFVTSFTTAATFLTTLLSPITAMQCFGIFATTAIIVNWFLMISWLPACMVLREQWKANPPKKKCNLCSNYFQLLRKYIAKLEINEHFKRFKQSFDQEQSIVNLVIKFRYIWITLFTFLIFVSLEVIFLYPGIQLPSSQEFQLFHNSHPFEKYDMEYKNKFWFHESEGQVEYKLPLRFVWGIDPVDNGNFMDPKMENTLQFDSKFDISSKESQLWLLNFCRSVRVQPFYHLTYGPLLENCFIESFIKWMKRHCVDNIYNVDHTPCCETSTFPYKRHIFTKCIVPAMIDLYDTPPEYFKPGNAGPKFEKAKIPKIKAIVIEYDSIFTLSNSYQYMHSFYEQVERWFQKQLEGAPPSLQKGWFISDLQFYDLQRVLVNETMSSVGISLLVSFVVLFGITLNIVTSCLAIVSVSSSILITLTLLVLMKWELNVVESTSILMGMGLAIDFSLHYAVHYNLTPDKNCRLSATTYALRMVLEPALMAAFTTCIAGAVMLPSSVLPYYHIGLFLNLIMIISSLVGIFYFGSLLAVLGPQNNFGQLHYLFCCCTCKRCKIKEPNQEIPQCNASLTSCEALEMDLLAEKVQYTKNRLENGCISNLTEHESLM